MKPWYAQKVKAMDGDAGELSTVNLHETLEDELWERKTGAYLLHYEEGAVRLPPALTYLESGHTDDGWETVYGHPTRDEMCAFYAFRGDRVYEWMPALNPGDTLTNVRQGSQFSAVAPVGGGSLRPLRSVFSPFTPL